MKALFLSTNKELSGIARKIRPQDIEFNSYGDSIPSSFGKHEVDSTAGRLVRFFEFKGNWGVFTLHELIEFYKLKGWDVNLMLFGITGYWFDDGPEQSHESFKCLAFFPSGEALVTDIFILKCARKHADIMRVLHTEPA